MRKRLWVGLSATAITAMMVVAAIAAGSAASKPPDGNTVSGTVVSNSGKPIAKAKVFVSTYEGRAEKTVTVLTDKQGRFKEVVSSPAYSVVALADGYCLNTWSNRMNNGQGNEIKLWPEHKIKGKVVDEDGKPIEGVTVSPTWIGAYSYSTRQEEVRVDNQLGLLSVKTGKDGSFVIGHLPRPQDFEQYGVSISANKSGRATMMKSFDKGNAGNALTLVQPLECVLECTLKLPEGAGPVPRDVSLLVCLDKRYGSDVRSAGQSGEGKFRVAALPPGTHTVIVSPQYPRYGADGKRTMPEPRSWTVPAATIELAPTQRKSVDVVAVKGSLVKGTVIDKTTDKPVTQAGVSIIDSASSEMIGSRRLLVDAEGKFVARVAPGPVKIVLDDVNQMYIQPETAPKVELTAVDGVDMADVVVRVDPTANSSSDYAAMSKPVADDFELKPGTYDLKWDPEVDTSGVARMSACKWDYVASFAFKKKPALVSSKPRYWIFKFDSMGDGTIGLIVDESKGTGKGYDTVYIDANRDWDLSNDKPLSIVAAPVQKTAFTDWVSVVSNQGSPRGERTANPVQLRLAMIWSGVKGDELYGNLYKKGAWKGTIESGKGPIECVLVDSNSNGLFGDSVKRTVRNVISDRGDIVCVDDNGYGKAIVTSYVPHAVHLSPVCKIGAKYYVIKPDVLGSKVTVEPYDGPMGSLSVQAHDICGMSGPANALAVFGPRGEFTLGNDKGAPMELPAGDYRVAMATVLLRSAGKTLPVSCASDSVVQVSPGQNTTLKISGKPICQIDPNVSVLSWKSGASVALNMDIRVGDKAKLTSIGTQSPESAPRVKFIDKAGKVIYTVTAGYT